MRKLERKATKFSTSAAVVGRKFAKKEHLGRLLGDVLRMSLAQAGPQPNSGQAVGSGAYGRGEYRMAPAVNSLFKEYQHRRHVTSSSSDETGRTTVSRREYVMRVTAPAQTEFSCTSFAINPGLSGVFAWLSQVACNYDEYELKHLIFHYKPVISQASQSGSMGSILMSANYNAGAPKFASFREMAEYAGSLETRICDEALFGVECDPTKHSSAPIEFIRSGTVPVGEDIKTYDLATFQLATSDIDAISFPVGTLLGHLYVEYEVTLGKPKLFAALGKQIYQDMFRGLATVTLAEPFTAAPVYNQHNTLGVTLAGNVATFPDNFFGTVHVSYHAYGTNATIAPPTVLGQVDLILVSGAGGIYSSDNMGAASGAMCDFYVSVSPSQAGIANQFLINLTAITTGSGFSMDIVQSNPDFISW